MLPPLIPTIPTNLSSPVHIYASSRRDQNHGPTELRLALQDLRTPDLDRSRAVLV